MNQEQIITCAWRRINTDHHEVEVGNLRGVITRGKSRGPWAWSVSVRIIDGDKQVWRIVKTGSSKGRGEAAEAVSQFILVNLQEVASD